MDSLQKQYYICNILVIVIAFVFLSGCKKRPPKSARTERKAVAVQSAPFPRPSNPVIRVGLKTDSKSVTLAGGDAVSYSDGLKTSAVRGALIVGLDFAPDSPVRYSVQVASFSSRENALKKQKELRSKISHPVYLFDNPDLGLIQVKVGPFSSQEKAQSVAEELKGKGVPQAFYAADSASLEELPHLMIRDELGNLVMKTDRSIDFWTSKPAITVDGAPYRGYISLIVNSAGRITVVNVLNMEDYLKGVVPNEIGPASESTMEALKAQAVAARTYAIKNMKQFDSEGYDICSTPRCQAYSGYGKEHILTTRAVMETSGEILTYQGEPINALYTSTCGGKTENAEFMFEGWNYPYLRSVQCYPEESEITKKVSQIRGEAQPWPLSWMAVKLDKKISGDLQKPIPKEEAVGEISSVLRHLGKTPCGETPLSGTDWINVGEYLVGQLCWQAKAKTLLDPKDYQYFASRLNLVPGPHVNAFLLMFREGIMVPPNQERKQFSPDRSMTRAEFFETMFHVMKHYRQINSREGQVREANGGSLQIVDDVGVHSLRLENPLYLFQKIGENLVPKDQLPCGSGDSIEYYGRGDSIQILVCEIHSSGAAVDRTSKYSFWQETFTPEELGQKVSRYIDAGEVLDVQPLSYGVSGRVFELKVTGSKNSGVLTGIRVRWGLGVRDNFFVVDRVLDRSGKIKQFTFTGRGWGHGVGMCQVGAIGFSKQGKDYKNILKHYYSSVQITKHY